MISSFLPTRTLPPNPPVANGHRKATKLAAANVSRLTLVRVTRGPVEELPAADADRLGIGRNPHRRRHRLGLGQPGAALLGDRGALDVATGGRGRQIDLGVTVAAT